MTLPGCGGGGASSGGTTPPPPTVANAVSGNVTDMAGAPIVGAAVNAVGKSTVSTQQGVYSVAVAIPAGQASLVTTVTASATIHGQAWSGQNQIEILTSQTTTSNANIVLSPTAAQGSITGSVKDASGKPLVSAQISASISTDVGNPATFRTSTDQNGAFTLLGLPPNASYLVTASYVGYINQSVSPVAVQTGGPTAVPPFVLQTTTSSPTPPAVATISAFSFTLPDSPTRSAVSVSAENGLHAIEQGIIARHGIGAHTMAAASSVVLHRSAGRSTPSGSIIENLIFWTYTPNITNLYGYDIVRATHIMPANFGSIATVRDPQATAYADIDAALTPDTTYYYNLARLDTINFPQNIAAGSSDPSPVTAVVEPLGPISLSAPANGATLSTAPTFTWTTVNRAAAYNVVVYSRFPDLQSNTTTQITDPNGAPILWQSPDVTAVTGQSTQSVTGPVLHGSGLYWAVVARDAAGTAYAISSIHSYNSP